MIEIRTSQKDNMNFKNKFDITTNKFYMVINASEGKEGELLFIYNGSISDYFKNDTDPSLVSYAGKAIKTINRIIAEKLENLSSTNDNFSYRHDLMSTIARLSDTVNELSKYKEYDLVGIYEKDSYDYRVVDYKKIEEIGVKDKGYKFVEISKELYVNIANIENKKKTQSNNQQINQIKREKESSTRKQIKEDKIFKYLVMTVVVIFSAVTAINFWAAYTDPANKTGSEVADDFLQATFNPYYGAQYLLERTHYKR